MTAVAGVPVGDARGGRAIRARRVSAWAMWSAAVLSSTSAAAAPISWSALESNSVSDNSTVGDPVHLGDPFGADFVEEWSKSTGRCSQAEASGQVNDVGYNWLGRLGWVKSPRTAGSRWMGSCPSASSTARSRLVDDVPEAIDDAAR